ncbi:MAG TPA: flagellar biosynthetic protein FliR [Opitutaceae bacterium]|nr:flagellar biosynthetic protein FliR [Opitutaceae bacterium]
MTPAYCVAWMMVFLRSLGLIMQLPVVAGRSLPIMVRVGLGACLATLLAAIVPVGPIPLTLSGLAFAAGGEVILGLLMGFMTKLTFSAVEMAGRIISPEIGLSASPGLGVPEPTTEPVASLFSSFAIICFFLLRGHEMLLSAFSKSFQLAAAGNVHFAPEAPSVILEATSHVIEIGVRIAAPFIGMNFLVTLAFSVLGRAAPKMGVFVMSLSVRAFAGIGLLASAGALLMRYLYVEFADAPMRMLQVLPFR